MDKHELLAELRRRDDEDDTCFSCERASWLPHADDCVTENGAVLIERQHAEIERLRRIVDWFVEDRNEDFIDVGDPEWQPKHMRPWIAYDGMGVDKEIPDEVIESFREYRRG